MRNRSKNQLTRWVGGCLIALAVVGAAEASPPMTTTTPATPTPATPAAPATTTPTTPTTTTPTTSNGLFSFPTLTADEQTQLMAEAMMVADFVFGILGATPTEEEFSATAEAFYHILLFFTLFEKI